ncbi:3-phytase [Altererythrobacter sp. B11]|nr:3-phytase [Altererythrobacter sp. B11]
MASALAASLAACAATPPIAGLPAVPVTASGETKPVGTANADAADDPAIWRNPADPAASYIVATDKKAGLQVYDLAGKLVFAEESGRVNNVDLADMGPDGVIVVASDRNDLANAHLVIWRLDKATGHLARLGRVPGGTGEGYGLCLWKGADGLYAFSVLKDGTVEEFLLSLGSEPASRMVRKMKVPTQAEGCVVDPRDGTLYVGEEDAGIWRFAPGETAGTVVAPADNKYLVADVEGLALLPDGARGGYLLASSQGDNSYAVFSLPDVAPIGRFRIAAGTFGATEETDGIEVMGGSFGPEYPEGLFVAQDGHNAPQAQNFKLVSWKAIREALGL